MNLARGCSSVVARLCRTCKSLALPSKGRSRREEKDDSQPCWSMCGIPRAESQPLRRRGGKIIMRMTLALHHTKLVASLGNMVYSPSFKSPQDFTSWIQTARVQILTMPHDFEKGD